MGSPCESAEKVGDVMTVGLLFIICFVGVLLMFVVYPIILHKFVNVWVDVWMIVVSTLCGMGILALLGWGGYELIKYLIAHWSMPL